MCVGFKEGNNMLAKKIWDTLSPINVNEFVEKKNGFTYLSWSWAHQTLMSHFPDNWCHYDEEKYDDGTVMVTCYLSIREGDEVATRHMHLPCLDYRNKPIANPSAMAINTTRQRAYVKTLSLFGLGLYIYSGEDIPQAEKVADEQVITPKESLEIAKLIDDTGSDIEKFKSAFAVDDISKLTKAQFKRAKDLLEKKRG